VFRTGYQGNGLSGSDYQGIRLSGRSLLPFRILNIYLPIRQLGLLALKAVPRCGLREMSVFLRLGAVYVSLLANIGVLYQILSLISSRF